MKNLKNFFTSKINIAGLLLVLISLQDFINNYDFAEMSLKSWVTFAIGICVVVFRTYFTTDKFQKKENENNNIA